VRAADTYRTDLELRLISLSLRDRLIGLTACVPAFVTFRCVPSTDAVRPWHCLDITKHQRNFRSWGVDRKSSAHFQNGAIDTSETRLNDEQTDNAHNFLRPRGRSVKPVKEKRTCAVALMGCAAASMRHHDEIRVCSRLGAKSVVGNNQRRGRRQEFRDSLNRVLRYFDAVEGSVGFMGQRYR
jgi:hypothetical protein